MLGIQFLKLGSNGVLQVFIELRCPVQALLSVSHRFLPASILDFAQASPLLSNLGLNLFAFSRHGAK
ncbi:hypothetical protein IPC1285_09595 [Pseudomonas aeruginosa]|nr:hypothetical protein IPC1285_09595 [Pseudomonas aeruginosa]